MNKRKVISIFLTACLLVGTTGCASSEQSAGDTLQTVSASADGVVERLAQAEAEEAAQEETYGTGEADTANMAADQAAETDDQAAEAENLTADAAAEAANTAADAAAVK